MSRDADVLPLIPYPTAVQAADDVRLGARLRIVAAPELATEAALLAGALGVRTGGDVEVAVGQTPAPGDIELSLAVSDGGPESYALRTDDGIVRVSAPAPAGAHWGAQTVRQLLARDEDGWLVRGARIDDEPRFAYRGAMLDVARHFFPVDEVLTYVDRITAYKVNALHLHLTDDQGWRIEVPGWPKLTELGSSAAATEDSGGFYSVADYRRIVEYAAARHVTVVPEIDTPGHTHAVTVAYPEFAEAPVIPDWLRDDAAERGQALPEFGAAYTGWGVGFSSLKPTDEATAAFIADVFEQVAAVTPGPWLHLGGDECLGTSADDYAAFVRRAAEAVSAAGKVPVTWHEAGRVPGLPAGTVGQFWGARVPTAEHADEARGFVENGGALILSPSDVAYLDMKYDDDFPIGLTWADGPTSVEASYDWDPAEVVPGVDDADVLGVEAPLWTETVTSLAEADALAFPRLAGIAEIGWTPRTSPERTWASARSRIAGQRPAWEAEGVRFHASEEIPWPPSPQQAAR